ncbi:MAG: hypothetical protein MUF49_21950 [Oculatellaceae cyanobacterium Prado106]|jgi:hypothetical protein|nr:hypothetical protein [Oculatellaceae cyanobacterium Prado106]
MQRLPFSPLFAFLGWITFAAVSLVPAPHSLAQTQSACQPPRDNEYLILVRNQRSDTQSQLQRLLPNNAILTPCSYTNNESVIRVEGFASAEIANAWAKYLIDSSGVQAFVVSPTSGGSTVANQPSNSGRPAPNNNSNSNSNSGAGSFPTPTTNNSNRPSNTPSNSNTPNRPTPVAASGTTSQFNPQPLGEGYAVLVNYFNRPEVANDVRQVVNRSVGLVSYEQQPYLLASFTSDSAAASRVLSLLSDRGFVAVIVDSRRAILLTPSVR